MERMARQTVRMERMASMARTEVIPNESEIEHRYHLYPFIVSDAFRSERRNGVWGYQHHVPTDLYALS